MNTFLFLATFLTALIASQSVDVIDVDDNALLNVLGLFFNELFEKFINDLPAAALSPFDLNTVYKLMLEKIRNGLNNPDIVVPEIGNSTSKLSMKDLHIIGLNSTWIELVGAKTGYNIESLKVNFSEIILEAKNYHMEGIELGKMGIALNGDGHLRVVLSDFGFVSSFTITYKSATKEFTVKTIGWWEFSIGNIQVNLQNLGGTGDAMSEFLNELFNDVATLVARALNDEILRMKNAENSEWTEKFESKLMPVISNLMTQAVKKITG